MVDYHACAAHVTGSNAEDAAPPRHRLRSMGNFGHWAQWKLLSSDTVQVAGQKRRVACSQLSDSGALASGLAKSPVCLRIGLSSQSAVTV